MEFQDTTAGVSPRVAEQGFAKGSARVAALLDGIVVRHPLHEAYLRHSIDFLSDAELARLDVVLGYLLDQGHALDYVVDCYLTIVEDTTVEQMHFLRFGEYRNSTYADVAAHVYNNPGYMNRYMYGLVLTAFLWPNHVRFSRFFDETFPMDRSGRYLEVGPGHGYFMASAASRGAFDEYLGIDISETSIAQTRALIERFAPEAVARCTLRCMDLLAADDLEPASFDAIVMGEVLEHVENPVAFLERLRTLARDDAHVYITTCVNAPSIDHIYLWRTTDSLEQMIADSGFEIVNALRLPYEGKTLEQARAKSLPISVAYVLRKSQP